MTSIRQTYKDQTRDRILDAVIDQMGDADAGELTIAQVAARAGVTERTVYRHFGTRDALVQAVWPKMQRHVGSRGFPGSARALVGTPLHLFPKFDAAEGVVRASVYSEAGREVRLRANDERQAAMRACVQDALPDLSPEVRTRRAAIVQLIDSAFGWSVLRDFWGMDGAEAGQAAAEAIAVLLGLAAPDDDRIDLEPYRQEEDKE